MVVGVCQIFLKLPGNNSLKGKRSIIRKILDKSRHRFNVAVAEICEMDTKQRSTIGFAVVTNDSRHANSMLDKIASFVSGVSDAVIVNQRFEIIHLDDQIEQEYFNMDAINQKFKE